MRVHVPCGLTKPHAQYVSLSSNHPQPPTQTRCFHWQAAHARPCHKLPTLVSDKTPKKEIRRHDTLRKHQTLITSHHTNDTSAPPFFLSRCFCEVCHPPNNGLATPANRRLTRRPPALCICLLLQIAATLVAATRNSRNMRCSNHQPTPTGLSTSCPGESEHAVLNAVVTPDEPTDTKQLPAP